jgi:hypothetical protein
MGFFTFVRPILSVFLCCSLSVALAQNSDQWPPVQRLNPEKVLFGHEATVQTDAMADQDGPTSMASSHKLQMLEKLMANYEAVTRDKINNIIDNRQIDFKPHIDVTFASGENVVLDMEPGCLEWNFKPKTIFNLLTTWKPFFLAADKAGLVSYVYRAGRSAGGGHYHVGGVKPSENPFIKYPLLLRNVLVYFHNHPSLLYGFAEGFDVGSDSSNWNFHDENRKAAFERAISRFDSWYQSADSASGMRSLGKLLSLLNQSESAQLIKHDNFINLQHIVRFINGEEGSENKATVEFRGVRPLSSAVEVEAVGRMLFHILDYLSVPDQVVEFERFTEGQSRNMLSPTVIESDWQVVREEIGLKSSTLDTLVKVVTRNSDLGRRKNGERTSRMAYSEVDREGSNREIVVEVKPGQAFPEFIEYQGYTIETTRAEIDRKVYAVGVFAKDQLDSFGITGGMACRKLFVR